MGRRKLGQPRVHRIVVMDQFSNEIESHELDEFGRLKEKISNTKRPRATNFLTNNNNTNIQGQINKIEINRDNQRTNMHAPHAYLNMPTNIINNVVSQENSIDPNNDTNVNIIPDLNEKDLQNDYFYIPPLNLLSNNPANSHNEIKDNLFKRPQNSFNDAQNKNLFTNIPQPQISPQLQESNPQTYPQAPPQIFHQIRQEENAARPLEIINSQTTPNSIPIPMLISSNTNSQIQFNSNKSILPPINQINNYNHPTINANQHLSRPTFSSPASKHFIFKTIFEFPEDPSIPLFITPDDL